MFDDLDPKDFADTARAVVETCAEAADCAARGRLLAEAGLLGVIAPEEIGGLGLPITFAVPIVSAAGEGLLAYPLIETLLLSRAFAGIDTDLAARICAGETLATIAWAGTDACGAPAGAPMGLGAEHVLIFRADGSAVLAPVGSSVWAEETASLDIDVPEAVMRLQGPLEGMGLDAESVRALIEDAKLLRAAFISGSASRCLALASDYAQERTQFGKPLSANQVLRHRLSRDALALETMRNGLTRALSDEGQSADLAREAAWLGAAITGAGVAESAIQVFGGMGFTWEVPLHRHLRQMRAQARYGGAAKGLEDLGEALLLGTSNPWYREIPNAV